MKRWQKTLLIVLLSMLGVVLFGPFLIPVPELEGLKTELELADADSRFVEVNGLTIHYKELGRGETAFILLHGFGANLFSWREVMDDFAGYGRVIAYDRPAFGLTSRPMPGDWEGESPYSMNSNISILAGLMDALGIRQAVLVGNSAGGTVSAAFALQYPERVTGLILVDPALGTGGGRFPQWILPLLATPQMRHLGPLLVRNIARTGNDTILQAWHDPSLVSEEIIAGYRKPLQAENWDGALYEFTIAARLQGLDESLDKLSQPVIVITGNDDRIIPTEQSIELSGQIPGSQLAVLPACGHVPQEECPEAFMQAVKDFLEAYKLI